MNYDITWIMQSFLGEYPGSRSDSDKKFIRAVQSFIDINDPRTQLVIASDGCDITHKLYHKYFKNYENIDYVYIDKNTPKMYEKGNSNQKYYRGLPRQVARSLAKGYLTAYIDSDDFLMPNASNIIKRWWNEYSRTNPEIEYKWGVMTKWIENIAFDEYVQKQNQQNPIFDKTGQPFKIEGLESLWQKYEMLEPSVNVQSTTWALVHRSDCTSKWKDIQSDPTNGGISEDTLFSRSIRKEGQGMIINSGFYVRCHYHGVWDY